MEQEVPKQQKLQEKLHLFADSPPAQGDPSISDLMIEAYEGHP